MICISFSKNEHPKPDQYTQTALQFEYIYEKKAMERMFVKRDGQTATQQRDHRQIEGIKTLVMLRSFEK